MPNARLPALIPVNRLDRAKGRLAPFLTPAERAELALATFETVLEAVRGAGWTPVVLTSDDTVRAAAGPNAVVLGEGSPFLGLNAELEGALLRLQPAFPQPTDPRLLVVHADLPLASAAAIRALCGEAREAASAVAVCSADGGTNIMLLRPPGLFAFAFGRESYVQHEARAAQAGLRWVRHESATLSLDLDTPADLLTLLDAPGGATSRAGKLLVRWRIRGRLNDGATA